MEKKKKCNWFDIAVVLLIIAVGVVGMMILNRSETDVAAQGRTVRYQVELIDNFEGFTEFVEVGDELTENIYNKYLGKVVAVEAMPYLLKSENSDGENVLQSPVAGAETTLLTIEAPVTETEKDITINGGFVLKTGVSITVKGDGGYAGRGYVLTIERED
ncbi:MAG: DUF4330 domain-containing protein [Bacillota bacterium]